MATKHRSALFINSRNRPNFLSCELCYFHIVLPCHVNAVDHDERYLRFSAADYKIVHSDATSENRYTIIGYIKLGFFCPTNFILSLWCCIIILKVLTLIRTGPTTYFYNLQLVTNLRSLSKQTRRYRKP